MKKIIYNAQFDDYKETLDLNIKMEEVMKELNNGINILHSIKI